jgi:glutaredoxin
MLESTMTNTIVYSKDNCPQCDKLKKELDRDGIEYVELLLGRDITREEFMRQFPHVRSMPHVLIA